MTQQDYTAPEMPLKVSRKERFQHVFQCFRQAEAPAPPETPDNLVGYVFGCQVYDRSGFLKLTLTEVDGLGRPALNAVSIEISTARMGALGAGQFRAELFGQKGAEREDFVHIILTIE